MPAGLVTIGTGNSNQYLPVYPYYGYTYSQSIYLQSEISIPDQRIEKIAFYWNGAGTGANSSDWVVYMGHTDNSTFASATSWLPLSELTQVYAGNLGLTATPGWKEIVLTNPFVYNNTQNLVIAIDENTPSYDGSVQFFYSTITTGQNRSIRYYADGTNPSPSAPPNGTLVAAYPNIMMTFGDLPVSPIITVSPDPVNYGSSYVGVTKSIQVSLSNTGGAPLIINGISLSDNTNFSLSNLPSFPLEIAVGAAPAQITLSFTPVSAGAISGELLVVGNQNATVTLNGTGVQPAEGEICESAYEITLPLVGYEGNTEALNNDYTSAMFTGVTNASYLSGKDWVGKVSITDLGNLSINVVNAGGAPTYQYMGVFLVNSIPSLAAPATVLAQAFGSVPLNIAGITVAPGDYYIIIDNWPTPNDFYFVLNVSFVPATDPPAAAVLVAPANEATNVAIAPTLSWTSGGGVVEKYFVSYGTVDPYSTIVVDYDNDLATTYTPSPLAYETEYWWSIKPWNSVAGYAQNVPEWTFTTMVDPTVQLPWSEDFTGVATGAMPLGWTRSHTNWGAVATSNAGGSSPELRMYWNPSVDAAVRAITPPLNGTNTDGYTFSFKHTVDHYSLGDPYTLKVEASTDLTNWTTLWSMVPTATVTAAEVNVTNDLSAYVGAPFYLAWTFDGYTYDINNWYVDDISIMPILNEPPALPILVSPINGAINLPKTGFDLVWAPDMANGGAPTDYIVYIADSEEEIFDQNFFEITDPSITSYNPVADGGMVFQYNDRWYWTVTAANSHGECDITGLQINRFDIQPDPTITSFPWTESFESYDNFALDFVPWTQYDGDGMTTWGVDSFTFPNQYYVGSYIIFNPSATTPAATSNWSAHSGSKYAAAFDANGDANNDWLITPPIASPGNLVFSFWAKSITAQYGLERFSVWVSTTDTNPASFTKISDGAYIEAPDVWTQYEYSLNYPGQTIYLAIQCVSDDAFAFFVDDIEIRIPQAIDMAAVGLSGDGAGRVNSPAAFDVTVANSGLNDVNNYFVYLKESVTDEVLAYEIINEVLTPGTSAVHELNWTPTAQGTYSVYAAVYTDGDANSENDATTAMTITVYSENMNLLYVGDPTSTTGSTAYPFDFYYEDFVAETIYLASEIQATAGTIEALQYVCQFPEADASEFQIWMKNTDVNNLSSGWLPFDGYTLVYDGVIGAPAGLSAVQIPITPFQYTGGNLAIRTSRTWEGLWANNRLWLVTVDANNPNRTIYYRDDDDSLDHENPVSGYLSNSVPNVIFFMDSNALVNTVASPVVDIQRVADNVQLDWDAVPYAYSYKVYRSENPYTFDTTPIQTVYTNKYSFAPGTADRAYFYKVSAATYRDFARSSFIQKPAQDQQLNPVADMQKEKAKVQRRMR